MKRSLDSTDSLGALMSICPTTPGGDPNQVSNHVYPREFQTMLEGFDEEGCEEETGGMMMTEKKRRLSVEQVKALEKNFEVENKLEPERKVKLAHELGLQPRQVAVWFQNRRARWKTKQLERDYGVLKANYDSLKIKYESLHHDNEALLKEIRELKGKLDGENGGSEAMVKEEAIESEQSIPQAISLLKDHDDETEVNLDDGHGALIDFADLKDGSSDSDSSAILNEERSPNLTAGMLCSGAFLNYFQFEHPMAGGAREKAEALQPASASHSVKVEEHNFFGGGEESCTSLFSDEQAPILHWYSPEDWN
ncbi:unnamed protein product [Cuscuta epithymum]|uniref:Homeobox-leucine zipper protein n=1 Tax=Cuscuta epithymum TaxID=186058 RepID=A0AAV0FIE3_9ASTE|nr:unnamed protein product [Cuscuta epithymum]